MQETTNNRMEIYAAVAGLRALNEPCDVQIYSDSAYLVNTFQRGWIRAWQNNDWKTSSKSPVENQDLWRQLLIAMQRHNVTWHKVKGHADNELNNRCDKIAVAEIEKYRAMLREGAQITAERNAETLN
jgi:ribonuclease HI